jgi:hypothetical protein
MKHVYLFVIMVSFASATYASELLNSPPPCPSPAEHTPDESIYYQGGTDVEGWPLPPANAYQQSTIELAFPLTVQLSEFVNDPQQKKLFRQTEIPFGSVHLKDGEADVDILGYSHDRQDDLLNPGCK